MSLQALYLSCLAHPAQALNSLALFFAIAGSWLLLATRMREQRAQARLSAAGALEDIEDDGELDDATLRLNRFFSLTRRFYQGAAEALLKAKAPQLL